MEDSVHYGAQLDKENIVTEIICLPLYITNDDEVMAFTESIGLTGVWLYVDAVSRGGFPSPCYYYDVALDVFVAPEVPESP